MVERNQAINYANTPWWARSTEGTMPTQGYVNPPDLEALAQIDSRLPSVDPLSILSDYPTEEAFIGPMPAPPGQFGAQMAGGVPQFTLRGNAPDEQMDLSQYPGMQDIGAQAPWGMDQAEWEGLRNPAGGTFSQMESTVQDTYQRPSASEEMRKRQEDAMNRVRTHEYALSVGPRGNPESRAQLQRSRDAAMQDFSIASEMVKQDEARIQNERQFGLQNRAQTSSEQYQQGQMDEAQKRNAAYTEYMGAREAAERQNIELTGLSMGNWPEGDERAGTPVPEELRQQARLHLKLKDLPIDKMTDQQKALIEPWIKILEHDQRENKGKREEEILQKIQEIIGVSGAPQDAGGELLMGLQGVTDALRNYNP